MSMGAEVITTALTVDYTTGGAVVQALNHPTMHVASGSTLALMGPSGCGKSTLLALLAGLSVPTTGSVSIGETPVSTLDERGRTAFRRAHVGMVFQADNLMPYLTVEENVALALFVGSSHTVTAMDAETETRRTLTQLGLSELCDRYPDQLSGGQRQRVSVARAIVGGPDLLLADEPTGALDGANAQKVVTLLLKAQQTTGATLILATHDAAIAAHADRVEMVTSSGPSQ